MVLRATIIGLIALALSGCAKAQPVTSAQSACAVATARVTFERHLPLSHVASCEDIEEADSPDGYYVLALFAYCKEELCGSTNMGWFAVNRATGEVFEVADVADWKLGRRLEPSKLRPVSASVSASATDP